jgi:hypothetical protein
LPPKAPVPRQIRSWQDAEVNAAEWMRYWGYRNAVARPGGPDGGADVRATGALGQVKYQAALVGRPELQRLVGARGRALETELLFFTGSDYAATALAYADEMDIALFQFALDGSMTALNVPGRRISERPAGRWVAQPAAAGGDAPVPASAGRTGCLPIIGLLFVCAPFGSIGDEDVYTGPLVLDVLKFIGTLAFFWLIGGAMLRHAVRRRRQDHIDKGEGDKGLR